MSTLEIIFENLFSRKNKKNIIKLSFAELAQRAVKVRIVFRENRTAFRFIHMKNKKKNKKINK